jgi:hypothetical protein
MAGCHSSAINATEVMPKSPAATQVVGQRKPVQAQKAVPQIASSANRMYRREGR